MIAQIRRRVLGERGESPEAFTLTEILVVIGILVTLVLLLLPSAGSAIDNAKRSKCVSNLRGIAQANSQFMADTGTLPRYGLFVNGNNTMSWYMALLPYISSTNSASVQTNTMAFFRSVGWCPAEPRSEITATAGGLRHSYGWNAMITGPQAGEQPKVGYFENLSKLFLVADQKPSVDYRIPALAWNADVSTSLFSARHRGVCNLAFADGHVESVALTNLPMRNTTHSTPADQKAAFNAFWYGRQMP